VPEESVRSVFVVDDEPVIVLTVTAILNHSGFHATGFESADAAIQATESESPDLLITDVSMPGMNGIDLAIRFKSLCPNCRTILFSGHVSTADLLKDAKAQGHDFEILPKPIHPKDMLDAIRKLWRSPRWPFSKDEREGT
jgi:DNA-binding NtrC family response regulator